MFHFVVFMTTGKHGRLVKLMQEKRQTQTFRYHEKFYIVRKYNSAVHEMAKKESELVSEIIFAVMTVLIVFTLRNAPCPNVVSLEKYMNIIQNSDCSPENIGLFITNKRVWEKKFCSGLISTVFKYLNSF